MQFTKARCESLCCMVVADILMEKKKKKKGVLLLQCVMLGSIIFWVLGNC